MVNRYRWLLFDADGTLYDFDKAERQALDRTLEQASSQLAKQDLEGYREIFRRINGNLWRAFEQGEINQDDLKVARFTQLVEEIGLPGDPKLMSESYLMNLSDNSDLLPGAYELLQRLSPDYTMAIITNGLTAVQRPRFGRSPIRHFFSATIISGEVGAAKPHRRIFDVAFESMGRPDREKVLIIGDSLSSDITGGIRYGIDTCWFNPHGRPRPDDLDIRYEIQELGQLPGILAAA